jgi:hypothetical protein
MEDMKQTFVAEATLKNIVESDKMQMILQALKQEESSQTKVETSQNIAQRTLN